MLEIVIFELQNILNMNYGKSKNKATKKAYLQNTTKEDGTKYPSARAFKKDLGVSLRKAAKPMPMPKMGTVQKGAKKK